MSSVRGTIPHSRVRAASMWLNVALGWAWGLYVPKEAAARRRVAAEVEVEVEVEVERRMS
jgi:hypothetical protein